jgi:YcaO-like protein with predicted kinase domain
MLIPVLSRLGITRVANVTGLDVIGLPVWQAIRPNSRSLAVSQGKGLDDASAKVSAILESLEAHHAEQAACDSVRLTSYDALLAEGAPVVDPYRLPLKSGRFDRGMVLPWARGEDLTTKTDLYVPFELVHANFTVPRIPFSGAFIASTNGLGVGNTKSEGVLHGLCELIERDADALWNIGGEETKKATRVDVMKTIDEHSNKTAHRYIELFRRAGLELLVWDLTSDIGIACFSVVVFDLESDPDLNPRPAAEGSGCHPIREVALCRALAEAAQGRLTSIAGSRDDFSTAHYEAFQSRETLDRWRKEVSAPATKSFLDVPNRKALRSAEAALDEVVSALAARGMKQIAVVDLTQDRDLIDLTFVRVIVPGLEGSIASPSYEPGERALAIRRGAPS